MLKNNSLSVIIPFDYAGMWVFSDAAAGLTREPFVAGADVMITKLVEARGIHDAKQGFRLMFAGQWFPDTQVQLDWVPGKPLTLTDGKTIPNPGNTYYCKALDQEGWLCPALFRYFDKAPAHIYAAAQPLGRGREARRLRKQIRKEQAFNLPSVYAHTHGHGRGREVGYIYGGSYHQTDPNDVPPPDTKPWWRDWTGPWNW